MGVAGLSVWLILSGFAANAGDGALFRRWGALGVAVVVAYFAAARLFQSQPAPPGYHESSEINTRNFILTGRLAHMALWQCSLIAACIKIDNDRQGVPTPTPIEALARPLLSGAPSPEQFSADTDLENRLAANLADKLAADAVVARVDCRIEITQAVAIVVATLQWGFGDLLFAGSGGA
ncbi:hypothetical protein EV216_11464 [Rhodovulum steppense]|uniref:Uncharacterized protein n=1 Tax=Rhodovulum steppense TaxID=540251 RepID=A0A4R1YT32_9RHOB|nr:hypothetical protein EV216_11464 [Rhodovulum steppense]